LVQAEAQEAMDQQQTFQALVHKLLLLTSTVEVEGEVPVREELQAVALEVVEQELQD
jgi:hypothetical protein